MAILDFPEYIPDTRRVRWFMAFVAIGVISILARLWYLQIAHGEELEEASLGNQRRLIRRVPPRGVIEDASGKVIATNRPRIVVSVVPEEAKKNPEMLPLLASLLNMQPQELAQTIETNKTTTFDPVRVAIDVDMTTTTKIEEQRLSLPGVMIGPEPIRYYPDGPLCGHLMGQMGQIPKEEMKAKKEEGYRPGDFCGRLGLERAYDDYLHGTNGGREIEVDARGRMRHEVSNLEPIPGDTIRLNIDKEMQKIAYDGLHDWALKGKPGAAVALDPQTGAVLALASVPCYDPNEFVNGVSKTDYKAIHDNPLLPEINRAVSSGFAPGSTFKLITATAGLETGKANLTDTTFCGGAMALGHWIKHCHKLSGHGSVNILEALAVSCDIYFYRLAQRLGPDTLAEYARKYGLGSRTGIDLPKVETKGNVPDPAWKLKRFHQEWLAGETVDYGIGQSMLLCSPIQMCNAVCAIANGGTLYKPQLVKSVTQYDAEGHAKVVKQMKPEVLHKLGVSQATLSKVIDGMRRVMAPGGTAYSSSIPGINMAGKTGTAQMKDKGQTVNNAWFVGYAPVEHPRIAICVFIQGGGHGGAVAAPIAKKMFAHYLKVKADSAGGGENLD